MTIKETDEAIRRKIEHLGGKCRICNCSNFHPCSPSCSWVEADLCSNCSFTVKTLIAWTDSAYRPNKHALLKEFEKVQESRGKRTKAAAGGGR